MTFHIDANFLDFVVYPIVVVLIGVVGRFIWKLAAREANRIETVEHLHVEPAPIVAPDPDALAALATSLGKSEARIDHLEELLNQALGRISSLERNEGHLIAWIRTLHTGIEDGTIPPMLDIPTHIRALLGI